MAQTGGSENGLANVEKGRALEVFGGDFSPIKKSMPIRLLANFAFYTTGCGHGFLYDRHCMLRCSFCG
jgi:hypothetical protein